MTTSLKCRHTHQLLPGGFSPFFLLFVFLFISYNKALSCGYTHTFVLECMCACLYVCMCVCVHSGWILFGVPIHTYCVTATLFTILKLWRQSKKWKFSVFLCIHLYTHTYTCIRTSSFVNRGRGNTSVGIASGFVVQN